MSLVVIVRTRENACWKTLVAENDLDEAAVCAEAEGWDVSIRPYVPEDDD